MEEGWSRSDTGSWLHNDDDDGDDDDGQVRHNILHKHKSEKYTMMMMGDHL